MLQVIQCIAASLWSSDAALNQSNGRKGGGVDGNAEDLMPTQIRQVWEKTEITPRFLI